MAARPPDMNDWYTRQGLTVKGGGITLQAGGAIKGGQTDYATGTGFFLGYSGAAYKFSIGSASQYLRFDGTNISFSGVLSGATGTFSGALSAATGTFSGDISGASGTFTGNLNLVGSAIFNGATSVGGATGAALINTNANTTGGQTNGLVSYTSSGSGVAIQGIAVSSGAGGVYGTSVTGYGGRFTGGSSSATALSVSAWSASSLALNITSGTFKWGSYTWAMPSGSTSTYLRNDGTWATPPGTGVTSAEVAKAIEYQTVSASAGALQGYIVIETIDGTTGPVKIPYYAV